MNMENRFCPLKWIIFALICILFFANSIFSAVYDTNNSFIIDLFLVIAAIVIMTPKKESRFEYRSLITTSAIFFLLSLLIFILTVIIRFH